MTDPEEIYKDAAQLARQLHAEHWPENTGWSPLEDTRGVLTQISNMCTLMREQKAEIARLRRQVSLLNGHDTLAQLEAHIDEQAAEIARLKAALREIANMDDPAISAQQVAADALEGKDD